MDLVLLCAFILFVLCTLTFYKRQQLGDGEVFGANIFMFVTVIIWWHVEYYWFGGIGVYFLYAASIWSYVMIVGSILGTFCHFLAVTKASR